jgi:hypothetical protein
MVVFIFKSGGRNLRMAMAFKEYKPSEYFQSLGVFENVPAMRFAEFVEFLEAKEGNERLETRISPLCFCFKNRHGGARVPRLIF